MIRKVPNVDSPITAADMAYAARRSRDASVGRELATAMANYAGIRYAYPASSGIAAFYVILKALAASSKRQEVVLPAYTAGSLIVAVRKAGLVPVLCDISLGDLNADPGELVKAVSDKTLAVVSIHMFGIPMDAIAGLKGKLPPGVAVIEDCAQAMGSSIRGKLVGGFGDVSFFSFNRGKNLPACGGGLIATDDPGLSESLIGAARSCARSKRENSVSAAAKAIAFSMAVNPYIYGILYGILARFKETVPPLDFPVGGMSTFREALVLAMLGRFGLLAAARHENGMLLTNGLKGLEGVTVPAVPAGNRAAFNRFPVVFRDAVTRGLAAERLWRAGIETSRMYHRPLHHMFDLGYAKGDFPNACYASERLLTLPVHPSAGRERLARAVDIIRGAVA